MTKILSKKRFHVKLKYKPRNFKNYVTLKGGENCKDCKVGLYSNSTTDGVVTNCMNCSCPFPEAEGNFADSCSVKDG